MNDITRPLRLATGSHKAGSGKGCAMNVVSWENGDSVITDYPACSARPLARLVQTVNDTICNHAQDGLLCVTCSQVVLELGHATIGTASASREQEAQWWAELLAGEWGVIQYADNDIARRAIVAVSTLFTRRANGDEPTRDEWRAAAASAYATAAAAADASAADAYAAAAAYAADADADAYAADADAKRKQYEAMADKLIELLEAA